MNIHEWAKRHNIPNAALDELLHSVGAIHNVKSELSEGALYCAEEIRALKGEPL